MTQSESATKPDFLPNYAEYWDNPELTGIQAAALALGIDPEVLAKCDSFHKKDFPNPVVPSEHNISEEDAALWHAFIRFCHYDLWPPGRDTGDRISKAMAENVIYAARELADLWGIQKIGGDKTRFVFHLYAYGTGASYGLSSEPHPSFVTFLKGRGEWPDCWDADKRPNQYFIPDRQTFDFNGKINTPEEAAVALYGLVPKDALEYFKLSQEVRPLSDRDMFFKRTYVGVLAQAYSFLVDGGCARLLQWMAKERSLPRERRNMPEWSGSFSTYLQALYDAGVIFAEHMDDIVRRYYPNGLQYSPEAKPVIMNRKWVANNALNFEQACQLYAGKEPAVRGFCLVNLRKDQGLFEPRPIRSDLGSTTGSNHRQQNEKACTPESSDIMQDLRYRASCHVTAKTLITLNSSEMDPERWMFKPNDIFTWLIKNTVTAPPPALLEVLGLAKSQKKKAQAISSAALEKEYKKHIENCEGKGVFPSWKEDQTAMESALGKKPTNKQIKATRAKLAPDAWKQRGRRRAA